jgi:putative oxidoreductase
MRPTASTGILLLRLALGTIAIAHGLQKLLLQGVDATAAGFAGMGVPLAEVAAPLVIATEVVGGALIVLGLGARFAAVALGIAMTVAMLLVHLPAGFFAADGGVEFTMLLAAASFTLALTGSGRLSLDAVLVRSRRSRRSRRLSPAAA